MTAGLAPAALGLPTLARSGLPAEGAARLAAALDVSPAPRPGEVLPLLWHWAFFTPELPNSELGHDGHPRLPEGGPTRGLPRRMFAGGRCRHVGPLVLGVPAERRAEVARADPKTGRSGRLLVVTVRYEILQEGRTVLEEEQDLVYREEGGPIPLPEGEDRPPAPPGGWREELRLDRVALFRFSAATFNAHRIHYDTDYAQQVESYPQLVVQGPLVALLLAQSARSHSGAELASYEFRATAPVFEGLPLWITGEPGSEAIRMAAVRNDGQPAMHATATLLRSSM